MDSSGRFEVIAKTARVDADLNSRDARLSRLADDPVLLRQALSEGEDHTFATLLKPSTSDAVAMVSNQNLSIGSRHSHSNRPYAETMANSEARTSLHPVRYDGAADSSGSKPAAARELMQFAILAGSTFCFLALAAVLLFAG